MDEVHPVMAAATVVSAVAEVFALEDAAA